MNIAIVGGGISGLSAAWYACSSEQQNEVQLFEASSRVGGVIETVRLNGHLIEKGADNFATLLPDALRLSRECGIEEMLVPPTQEHRRALVRSSGRNVPIPEGFSLMQPTQALSILCSPILSWRARMRVIAEPLIAREPRNVQTDKTAGIGTDPWDESLESFAVRRLGREAFEKLVEPIVGGIFTADPSKLSMAATMPQFLKMEREHGGLVRGHWAQRKVDAAAAARKASGARYDQFLAPRDGMSSWIDAIAASLDKEVIHTNCPLESIARLGQTWELRFKSGERKDFDRVILATPAAITKDLLSDTDAELSALIGGIGYASSAVAAVVLKRAEIRGNVDAFGLIIPSRENRNSLAMSFTSNKYAGRVPEDEILVRVFMGGALNEQLLMRSDDELMAIAHKELNEVIGWNGKNAVWQDLVRWDQAMPQYHVGHVERVQKIKSRLDQLGGIAVCGAAYSGVGIPQCVRSGRLAAEAVIGHE